MINRGNFQRETPSCTCWQILNSNRTAIMLAGNKLLICTQFKQRSKKQRALVIPCLVAYLHVYQSAYLSYSARQLGSDGGGGRLGKLCEQVGEDFINHSEVCDPENPNYPKTLLSARPGTRPWC